MKLDIGQVLKEGWDVLIKHPTILLAAFIGVLITEFAMVSDSLIAGFAVIAVYFGTFFLMTQYVYEASHGKPSWKVALRALLPKWPALIVTTLIFCIAFFAGMLLFLFPGVLLFVRWGAYDYAVMFDNAGIFDSFKKSWALTQGSFWRLFTVLVILYLPLIACEFIPRNNLFLAVNMIVQTFFQSWWSATMVLVYFQLKQIKGTAVA